MRRRHRVAAAAAVTAAGSFVALLVSGLWLSNRYRPGPWRDLGNGFFTGQLGGGWIHEVHVGSAIVLSAALAVLCGLGLMVAARTWRHEEGLVAASTIGMVALVAAFTSGSDLRWDQLALWAVEVDSSYEGTWSVAFSDRVRFFLVPGRGEVLPEVYRAQVVTHLLAAPAVIVVTATAGALLSTRRQLRDRVHAELGGADLIGELLAERRAAAEAEDGA